MTEFDVSMGASPCLCFSVCDFHLIWSSLPCRSTGMQDDFVFLLDESLTSIQLFALYMQMCNIEQLLASIGLLAYKVDSLPEANAALKTYGQKSFHGDCTSVKKKPDHQSPKVECPLSALCWVNLFLKCYMLSQISLKLMSCHLFWFRSN